MAKMSGLDRLVEAVEATEAAAAARTPHQVAGGFMCPHPGCARIFSKRYNQQAHMRLHDGTRPFACELCGKHFMWKSSLKSHAKMHAKLQAAEAHYNATGTSRARQTNAGDVSKTGRGISKSRSKGNKKEGERRGSGMSNVTNVIAPSSVPNVVHVPPLQLQSIVKVELRTKISNGRKSPDSISRVDHEAATALTLLR